MEDTVTPSSVRIIRKDKDTSPLYEDDDEYIKVTHSDAIASS
jgi:hypothetical protein